MEVESQAPASRNGAEYVSKAIRRTLVIVNFIMLVLSAVAAPLLLRIYFIHGGKRKWLSSWLQVCGVPIILIPLTLSYASRRRSDGILNLPTKAYFMTPRVFFASVSIGVFTGIDGLLSAYGISYLPISTVTILNSTQLGFTAFFAWFIVKQKFTAFSINAVALLTVGAVILGMDAAKDRPKGETKGQYYLGFFLMLGAAALCGLIMPLVELTYDKAKQIVTYTLVLEMQLIMATSATAFCTIGMIVNRDFQAIPREAKEFGLGEEKYYMILVISAIVLQFLLLGTIGVIFYNSALLVGVISAVLIPVNEVLAVIFLHEPFSRGKGISLALSLWGFTSYFYGEYKKNKKSTMKKANSGILNSQE